MTEGHLLEALGGLGLFLFSVRFLTAALGRFAGRRLKPFLARFLGTPLRAVLVGMGATALVQASSVTIITAMGLVATSLLTLEQGYYAMLGATVGTTIKAWVFSLNFERYGGAIVGLSSLALVFARRPSIRQILEIVLASGFTIFGLSLLADGLRPLADEPTFRSYLLMFDGKTLSHQLEGALVGMLLTLLVQSSSTIVVLSLHLATQQVMTLEAGALLILGANLGTALVPVLPALEQEPEVRRLAYAQVLVKVLGFLLVLLPFEYLLNLDKLLLAALGSSSIAHQLAAVHTLFNLTNAIVFGLLGDFILRRLEKMVPDKQEVHVSSAIPVVVRRMLSNNSELALSEAARQVRLLDAQTKTAVDSCFVALVERKVDVLSRTEESRLRREFESLRDACSDLLLRLTRRGLTAEQRGQIESSIRLIGRLEDINAQALGLLSCLTGSIAEQGLSSPETLRAPIADFQSAFDGLWLRVHFQQSAEQDHLGAIELGCRHLEQAYFTQVLDDARITPDQASFEHEIVSRLARMADSLMLLARQPGLARDGARATSEAGDGPEGREAQAS